MDNKDLPENLRQAVDLITAVLRRIKEKRLDSLPVPCLCITNQKEERYE